MGLVFPNLGRLSVYFRRISTGDGNVPAGLNKVSLSKRWLSKLDKDDPVRQEIIGY